MLAGRRGGSFHALFTAQTFLTQHSTRQMGLGVHSNLAMSIFLLLIKSEVLESGRAAKKTQKELQITDSVDKRRRYETVVLVFVRVKCEACRG